MSRSGLYMDLENKHLRLCLKAAGGVVVISYASIFWLSYSYYNSFKFNPVPLWVGANMQVRSLLYSIQQQPEVPRFEIVGEITKRIDSGTLSNNKVLEHERENLSVLDSVVLHDNAQMRLLHSHAKQQITKFSELEQQVAPLSMVVDRNLSREYEPDVQKEVQLTQRSAIAEYMEHETSEDLKSNNDFDASLSKNRDATSLSIPQSVLENVHDSTGISTEEIEEIFRK